MTKWQDISTAPKDGTELPLYRHDAGWFSGFYGTWEHIHTTEGEEAPTHWFRLPTPPTKGE